MTHDSCNLKLDNDQHCFGRIKVLIVIYFPFWLVACTKTLNAVSWLSPRRTFCYFSQTKKHYIIDGQRYL